MFESRHYTYPASLSPYAVLPIPFLAESTHTQHTHIATGAFIFTGASPPKILLLQRAATELAFPNRWEVPGGGAEPTDATILDTIVREVKEETGLIVTAVLEMLGYIEFRGSTGERWRKYNFLLEVEDREVKTDPMEHDGFGWFEEEEVRGLSATTEEQRENIKQAFARVKGLVGATGSDR